MSRGVRVEAVEEGSEAESAGFLAGDRLLSINGRAVEDHLDVRFHAALGDLEVEITRGADLRVLSVAESPRPLRGLVLEEIRPKRCANKCIFCFIDQLPAGVRPSLRVKDEDYRLSFLHGNYTTLSTLREREIERIIEQRLSPLYVSVHAFDEEVRNRMLGRAPARPFLPTLERLLDGGIELWGQVVLCPGVNDGPVLGETIRRMARYHPRMLGLAVVPLGLSSHRKPDPLLRSVTPRLARSAVRAVEDHQADLLGEMGTRFVFAADEFYLDASLPLPAEEAYEGFGMLEDGVGMARDFLGRWEGALGRWEGGAAGPREVTLVTGTLFAPLLAPLAREAEARTGRRLPVVPVENRFLGASVTVAGLLAGRDIAGALRKGRRGGVAAMPAEGISRANGLLLDDYTAEQVREGGGVDQLHVLDGPEDLFRLLAGAAPDSAGRGSYPHR